MGREVTTALWVVALVLVAMFVCYMGGTETGHMDDEGGDDEHPTRVA